MLCQSLSQISLSEPDEIKDPSSVDKNSNFGSNIQENCPDLRNSKVIELVTILQEYGLAVDIFDPHIFRGIAGEA